MTATPTSPGVPTTITNLPAAGVITGSELVAIVQNGVTCHVSANALTASSGVNSIIAGEGISVSNLSGNVTVGLVTPVAVSDGGTGTNTSTGTGAVVLANSPALSGTPTVPTATSGTNTTQAASTAFVETAIASINNMVAFNSITGFLPTAIAGTSTTAAVTVSAGQAADSTNSVYISRSQDSWRVTNGNAVNGYQQGTTLSNSMTIHFYAITGTSGTGIFACDETQILALPSGYTLFRRIFSLITTGTGAFRPYIFNEISGGAAQVWLETQTADISGQTPTTANRTLYTLASIPLGIKMQVLGRGVYIAGAASSSAIYTSPDETDVAPAAFNSAAAPGYDNADYSTSSSFISGVYNIKPLLTNASAQIGYRSSVATASSLNFITSGFIDFRRV